MDKYFYNNFKGALMQIENIFVNIFVFVWK